MADTHVTDPMPGSIARAVERVRGGYLLDERELGLALNEAYRNGTAAATAAEPDVITGARRGAAAP